MCCTWLAENTGRKKSPSAHHCITSSGYIFTTKAYGSQPNFGRRLAVSWAGTLYIHCWGRMPPNGILPGAKFTLRPSLAFSYICRVIARHSSSGRQPNSAAGYKEWNYGTFTDGAIYMAVRPSRWTSAHISSFCYFYGSSFSDIRQRTFSKFFHMTWIYPDIQALLQHFP